MSDYDWVQDLKSGDKVIIEDRHSFLEIAVVDRVTPSGIICIGNKKYNSRGYLMTKERFNIECLLQMTPERLDRIKRRNMVYNMKRLFDTHKDILTTEDISAICDILRKYKDKK